MATEGTDQEDSETDIGNHTDLEDLEEDTDIDCIYSDYIEFI